MKLYLQLSALLAAACVTASAQAGLRDEIVHGNLTVNMGNNPFSTHKYAVLHTNRGDFTDIFKFRLTEAGPMTTAHTSYTGFHWLNFFRISNAAFGLYTSSNVLVKEGEIIQAHRGESFGWLTSPTLANGSYYYKLTGDSIGRIGSSYMFSQTIAPCPEPSTYALMLIGLLGIGYFVGYRAHKQPAGMIAETAA